MVGASPREDSLEPPRASRRGLNLQRQRAQSTRKIVVFINALQKGFFLRKFIAVFYPFGK
jgi:hypothetical protein